MASTGGNPVAAAQSLSSPKAQQAFQSAIQQITASINSISKDFTDVKKGLPSVQDTGALQVELNKLADQYRRITWDSRDTSSEVKSYAEQLGTAILPIAADGATMGASDADVIQTLQGFQQMNVALGEKTSKAVADFSTLRNSLTNFQKQYQAFYLTKGTQQSSEISQLTADISELTFKADQIAAQIKQVAIEQQGTFLNRNKWVLACPIANLVLLLLDMLTDSQAKAQIERLRREHEDVSNQISRKKAALNKLQETAAAISKYKGIIDTLSDTRLRDVVNGIDIFNDIYQSGNEDVNDLIEYKNNKESGEVPLALAIYRQTNQSVYAAIIGSLTNFSKGVEQ